MTASLKEMITRGDLVKAPGVWDGMSARLAEEAGFPAVFVSGLAVAASMGRPDADIYTKTDILHALGNIESVSSVPVIADGDTGYGSAVNTYYMVRDFERLGVQAVTIEDQESPKRCPLLPGEPLELISVEEAAGRIEAAVAARKSEDFLVIARCDASTRDDMDRRLDAYAAAGADVLFPRVGDGTTFPVEAWAKLHDRTGLPLLCCPGPGRWAESAFDDATLKEVGVAIHWLATYPIFAAMGAVRKIMTDLRNAPTLAEAYDGSFTGVDLEHVVGYSEVESLRQRFMPPVPVG